MNECSDTIIIYVKDVCVQYEIWTKDLTFIGVWEIVWKDGWLVGRNFWNAINTSHRLTHTWKRSAYIATYKQQNVKSQKRTML